MTFNATHHATMLLDQHRLERYRDAIARQVHTDQNVVDIGTGTGILSHFIRANTTQKVYAVEYFSETAAVATKLLAERNVEVVNAASSQFSPDVELDCLVSEIIGPVGPEENIVETFYDMARRFPSIKTFIPSTLTMYAQPIFSPVIAEMMTNIWKAYESASLPGFDYSKIKQEVMTSVSSRIGHLNLANSEILGSPVCLAHYDLGRTQNSSFAGNVSFESDRANACHLFFEADLGGGVTLRSQIGTPITHWRHAYLVRPADCSTLKVSYKNTNKQFSNQWR